MRPRTGRLIVALAAMVLFVLAAVVLVGEVWVRPAVEDQIAKGIATELNLDTTPDVKVRGFPLLLRAVQERLDGIDIRVEGEVFEGMVVQRVDLHIDEVRFQTSELLGRSGTVVIAGGDGRADIADSDLSDYLASTGLPVDVRFDAGLVRVAGSVDTAGVAASASVTGELVLGSDRLRFTPTQVQLGPLDPSVDRAAVESVALQQFRFTAPVPQLRGVRLTALEIGDGVARIAAEFDELVVNY